MAKSQGDIVLSIRINNYYLDTIKIISMDSSVFLNWFRKINELFFTILIVFILIFNFLYAENENNQELQLKFYL